MTFVFFTDRDLGKHFPERLASAGLQVEHHDAIFPATSSVAWSKGMRLDRVECFRGIAPADRRPFYATSIKTSG